MAARVLSPAPTRRTLLACAAVAPIAASASSANAVRLDQVAPAGELKGVGSTDTPRDPSIAAWRRYRLAYEAVRTTEDAADDGPEWAEADAAWEAWHRTPSTSAAGVLRRLLEVFDCGEGRFVVTGALTSWDRARYAVLRDLARLAGEPAPRLVRVRRAPTPPAEREPPTPADVVLTGEERAEIECARARLQAVANEVLDRIDAIKAGARARGGAA
jgi:hypothetical protein